MGSDAGASWRVSRAPCLRARAAMTKPLRRVPEHRARRAEAALMVDATRVFPARRTAATEHRGSAELRETAVSEGMLTLRMDGIVKIEKGITTLEEVVKETAE